MPLSCAPGPLSSPMEEDIFSYGCSSSPPQTHGNEWGNIDNLCGENLPDRSVSPPGESRVQHCPWPFFPCTWERSRIDFFFPHLPEGSAKGTSPCADALPSTDGSAFGVESNWIQTPLWKCTLRASHDVCVSRTKRTQFQLRPLRPINILQSTTDLMAPLGRHSVISTNTKHVADVPLSPARHGHSCDTTVAQICLPLGLRCQLVTMTLYTRCRSELERHCCGCVGGSYANVKVSGTN